MQQEFESMEDYWQKKIEEERSLYESQLKMSESRFKDLETKMKDTEILLEIEESSKPCFDKSSLYIIDEQQYLEDQVNEWQEEINELKLHIEHLKESHEDQIVELSSLLSSTYSGDAMKDCVDKLFAKDQQDNSLLCDEGTQVPHIEEEEVKQLPMSSFVAYKVSTIK